MTHAGKFLPADALTGQNPGQDEVKDGDLVKHAAGGQAQDGDVSDPAAEKHGARQDWRAVDRIGGPGLFDAHARHIVGVNRHAAAGDDQIGARTDTAMDGLTDLGDVVRGKDDLDYLGTQGREFGAQNRLKPVLDPSVEDLIAGNNQTGPGLAQGLDLNHRGAGPGNGHGLIDQGPRRNQRNQAGACNGLALFHRGIGVEGGAHHLAQHVETVEGVDVDLQQTVAVGDDGNLAFHRLGRAGDPVTDQGGGQFFRGLILMDLFRSQLQDIDIVLAQTFQVVNIFGPDDMALLEGAALEFVFDDLGDIMGQDHAHSLFHGNCFSHYDF